MDIVVRERDITSLHARRRRVKLNREGARRVGGDTGGQPRGHRKTRRHHQWAEGRGTLPSLSTRYVRLIGVPAQGTRPKSVPSVVSGGLAINDLPPSALPLVAPHLDLRPLHDSSDGEIEGVFGGVIVADDDHAKRVDFRGIQLDREGVRRPRGQRGRATFRPV